jgi:hypothetical protein
MTQPPKEKAKDLIDKFSTRLKVLHELEGWVEHLDSSKAKGHALNAVDELIEQCYKSGINYSYDFWQEVKQEIEKL